MESLTLYKIIFLEYVLATFLFLYVSIKLFSLRICKTNKLGCKIAFMCLMASIVTGMVFIGGYMQEHDIYVVNLLLIGLIPLFWEVAK